MDLVRLVVRLPRWLRRHKLVSLLLWITPGRRIQLVRFNGSARLYADISDPFPRSYWMAGGYDPEFFDLTVPFLRQGGVFFDVGANVGFCTFGLIDRLRETPVEYHLFEANEALCRLLRRSAALHPGTPVHVNHACVTAEPGVSFLQIVPDHLGASYIAPTGTQAVPNVRLDDYIAEHGIDRVALVKLDVEGWEPMALVGAARSLRAGVIEALYVEIAASTLERAGSSPSACLRLLDDAGYELFLVKRLDFERGVADRRSARALPIHGVALHADGLRRFPDGYETDVLAVHRTALVRLAAPPGEGASVAGAAATLGPMQS